MDQLNKEMFEHKFTTDLKFISSVDKFKCFRVMDEEGNIVNKAYENTISPEELQKMFKMMVTINEADSVFLQA